MKIDNWILYLYKNQNKTFQSIILFVLCHGFIEKD